MRRIYRSVGRSDSAEEWEKRSDDRYKTGAGTEAVAVVEVV